MSKKSYAVMGMIVGTVMVLMGILTMSGAFGGAADTATSASYVYSSGYATFGADFYTYVTNNAGEAASAGRTTARNLYEIAGLLKNVFGIGLIGFGLFMNCLFGIKFAEAKAEAAAPQRGTAPAPAPVQAVPVEESKPAPQPVEKAEAKPEAKPEAASEPVPAASGKKESRPLDVDGFLTEIGQTDSMVDIWNIWRKYDVGSEYSEVQDYIRQNKDREQLHGKPENMEDIRKAIAEMLGR